MNNTITLSQLITRLAKATGVDNNTARRFLRTFFSTIEESLEAGESVSIKNIGTFHRSETDLNTGKTNVAFTPDAAFLEELNRPFDMFEAVELADGVDFSEVEKVEEPIFEETKTEETPEEITEIKSDFVAVETVWEPIPESEEEPVTQSVSPPITPEPETVTKSIVSEPNPYENMVKPPVIVEHDPVVVPPKGDFPSFEEEESEKGAFNVEESTKKKATKETEYEEEQKKPSRLWIWFALFLGVACILGYIAAVWVVPMPDNDYYNDEDSAVDTTAVVPIEEVSVEEVANVSEATENKTETPTSPVASSTVDESKTAAAPAPKAEPVYDTVEISLIKLAKKHYGIADYWVFIFDANRDKIKNPNAIRPGTKVLIPDKADLPGTSDAETRAIAKRKSDDYLSKF